MELSEFDPAARERVSWNAGRKVGAKRALKPCQIWAIRFFLDQHGRIRDRAFFDLAIDSKLRGCDLVKISASLLKWLELRGGSLEDYAFPSRTDHGAGQRGGFPPMMIIR